LSFVPPRFENSARLIVRHNLEFKEPSPSSLKIRARLPHDRFEDVKDTGLEVVRIESFTPPTTEFS
jgi:hypothetical protein